MEDEGRQRKLEAGKEKFAAYLKKKNASGYQSEQKKKKKIESETEDISADRESSPSSHESSERIKLDTSCKSNGTSIASDDGKLISEEGDVPHGRLRARVKELEDILSGKEAALEAAYEELSALKEISSLDLSSGMLETDYKTRLEEYQKRLQEFQEAVQDRERIIGQLSGSLKQAIETRDALQLQGDHLAQEVALLQNQLKATIESIQSHQWDTGIKPHDYLALQNQMLALKATVSKNESIIEDLRNIVKERDMMLLGKSDELEKKTQELSQHKTKSANEIQKLMREVEELHQRCAMQTSNQNSLIVEHEGQLASLHSEMEENFGLQLVQIKEELRNQFNEERERMEKEHAEEMTSYKALLVKLTEMSSRSEVDLVTSANEQLDLILTQLQNTLEAKELLEKEIAELKDSHKVQVNTLQCNISKLQKELEEMVNIKQNFEQNILEMRNYYEGELSSYKKQVENLNFQLQEASKAEANLSSQVLKYETELASCRQSYEMELSSLRQRMEALNLRLQEASEAEENFPKVLAAHKHSLESELTRYKEENELLNAEIQTGKMMIDALHKEKIEVQEFQKIATSYEEQSQNLRTSLKTTEETAARLQSETISLKLQLEETNKTAEEYVKEMASYKERISVLNVQLEKVENENRTLKEDLICCKEAHQQEIILLKQKFDLELNERASNIKCHSHEEELASCKQQIEFLNSRLQDANDAEKCHVSEINTCQVQLREYKEQVESLDKQFNELINAQERHSKEVSSKNQEIETLQECVLEASKMGEQYKNEQISLQSEIENLNKQLKERMETEKQHAAEMASYKEKLIAYSDQVEALKKLANTQDELEAYKLQVETLRESLQCEVSRLKSIHSTEIKEKEEHHALEMLSLKKKLEDLTSQLAEVNTARESLEKEKNVKHETHISEIAVYQQQLEELNVQIQKFSRNEEKYIEELTQYQTQLTSNKNIIESLYAKLQEETSQLKEVHLRELDEYKNKVQNLESERTRLEAAVADAVKQKEDTTNLNRAQLEEITIQYLKLQTLLAARDEVEESLEKRIKDLQSELNLANETITQMKQENDQLQEMTVQYLKLEGVLAGRDEMMKALTDQNQQLQETLDNVTKNLEESNKECTLLTQRVAKAKELLRRLKAEKDELAEKCKQLETDKAELSYRLHEGQLRDVAAEIITLENNQGLPIEDACSTKVVAPLESAAVVSPNSSNEQTVITIENSESNHNVNSSQIPESGPLKRRKRELAEIEEPVSSCLPQKWVDKLIAVEDEKTDLANKLELLESKLKEKELQEDIYIKETNTINLHCKELEEKLLELGKYKTQLDIVLQEKSDLELQIRNLKSENTTFHNFQEALNNELAEERISRENKIHNDLKEKYANIINEKNAESMEQLIIDLGGKAKENIFLQEKMRIQEQAYQSLQKKVLQFEECKDLDAEKLQICKNELERVRNELEESWKLHQATKDELGNLKKEFAMLQFHKQQLESSRSRLLQMGHSQLDITPAYTSSIHAVMEELASEVEALKSSLEFEQHRNEKLALELEVARNNSATDVNSNNNGTGMLELQHKLELILKSNTELVAEKEALLDKLRNQQQFIGKLQQAGGYEQVESWMSNLDKQQTDLMVELRAYREQHTSLAELVGSTGVLQETLYIQKQEVLRKLQEKSDIEKCLENEREELKNAQLKIQMMEYQLLEKDRISQALTRQKRLLEQDLHAIEDRLRDQEDILESQKQTLEAEIHARDLHIQHWKLELRRKQAEINTEQIMKTFDQEAKKCNKESENENTESGQRLELWRSQVDEIHQQAVARLKQHLGEQFSAKEAELKRNFSAEVATLEQQHKEQLLDLHHQLDEKVKEIEILTNKGVYHQLGISQDLPTRIRAEEIANIKKKQETELEELKNTLDEQQKEIYSVMKQKFEKFAEEQIVLALNVLQEEHNSVHQQEVNSLIQKHTEELKVLQTKLEKQRQEELMLLRQDLSRKYKNEVTKGLKLEFSVLNHPFSKLKGVHFLHLKQDMLSEYTSSKKSYVHNWFVKCQEHFEIINKQIESIWQSCKNVELEKRIERCTPSAEIEKLLENKEQFLTQLEGLQDEIIKCHVEALQKLETQFETEHSKLKESIENMNKTVQEGATIANLQEQITVLEEEKKDIEIKHRLAVDLLSQEQQVANLRQELEAKHAKEMEELRRYFEQKCADLEKHYSEEVFSQHSRKMSGSSSGSEEMVSDMYYAGGDHGQRLTALTHICDSYTVEPSFKDLEEHYRSDFEKRLIEYRDQLDTVKQELEQKYRHEMELLREEYESKVQELVMDLSNTHKTEIQNLESKHEKEMMNLKEKFQTESAAELSNVKLECAGEVEKVKKEMEEIHKQELETLKDEYQRKMNTQIENLTKQMKQEEVKHVEAVKSQLLNKHVKDIQELEESFADHVVDEMGKTSSDSVLQKVDMEHKIQMDLKQHFEEEHKKQMEEVIIEIQNKHAKELEAERKVLAEQFDEVTSMLKRSSEEEQEKFLQNQKEMVSNLMKQHQKDLQTLKMQLEEECKRLCREKVHQVKEKYEKENRLLKEELSKLTANRDTCKVQLLSMATKPVESTTKGNKTAEQIQQLQQEIKEKDDKLAEMKELHENELQQVRILCEGRLHDEVEQAKHDIVSALEEQIQALLANDSEDTQWPQELVELQEKFSARYKQELEQLKAEHAKQIAHLKDESDSELQSLSEKYNQLEEQHKLEKTKHDMQMKLGDLKDGGEVDAISILHADLEHLIKERDGLRKMSSTLRYLLGELVAYFTVCEDELNNTLIGELLKIESDVSPSGAETSKNNSTLADQGISSNVDRNDTKSSDSSGRKSDSSIKTGDTFSIESPVTSLNDADISVAAEQATCEDISMVSQSMEKSLVPATPRSASRRVHFAPDTSGIIGLIEEDKLLDYIEKNKDLSTDFRSELEHCLERLKEEASAVLGLSGALPRTVQITREAVASLEEKVNILTSRLEKEVKSKDELLIELQKFQETEKEATQLQEQFYGLEMDLRLARARVAELERELGKREDISEGFGESIQPGLVRRLQNMAQLQDKARTVLSERSGDQQKSPHLQLIEELCHEGDRLSEEARKEREDLQQQVDAADKQLRATRQFLEDQAAEREQERDDFLREIAKLQELLRERDRDRSEHQQLSKEDALEGSEQLVSVRTVEALELQVKEAAALQKESDHKKEELETELKAAVDKIWVLRDIICELESQVETKTQHETTLEQQLQELHAILEQQSQNHQELAEELDSLRVDSGKSELTEHINHLEEQLRKHRLHVEQFQSNSTAVKQMKAQLRDLEAAVDKKTKDLESFHANVSSGSCSSPSEDVSVREHLDSFRCDTPESQSQSPVCLPLDELHRLQDKLQRHSRAEEVALKRIRDLEMQLKGVKRNEEEVTAERDVLQERMEEQLLKISALQSRLDEQRRKADGLLKEANMELQTKVRDQDIELNKLREMVENKDKEVKELKDTLIETRRVMAAQESEWNANTRAEVETAEKLRELCRSLNLDISALQDEGDGSLGRIIPIEALIELLVGNKDGQIADLLRQIAELNRLIDDCASHLDPEQRAELEKKRKGIMAGGGNTLRGGDILRGDGTRDGTRAGASMGLGPLDTEDLYTSRREITDSESEPDESKGMKAKRGSRPPGSLQDQLADSTNIGLSELQNELKNKNEKLSDFEYQLSNIKESLKSAETDRNMCQEKCTQLENELEEALKKLDEKDGEINALQSHISGKDNVLRKVSEDKQESLIRMSQCEKEMEDLKSKIRELQECKEDSEALKIELLDSKDQNSKLMKGAAALKERLMGLVEENKTLKANVASGGGEMALNVSCQSTIEPKIEEIVNKILQDGIEALSFADLSYLHQQICKATCSTLMKDSAQAEKCWPSLFSASDDPEALQKRILSLENEITQKQKESEKKVLQLESAIRRERRQIENMKQKLEEEQMKNTELQNRLRVQSMSVGDLQMERDLFQKQLTYHEDRVREFIIQLEQERAKVRKFEDEVSKEKNCVKHLQSVLDAERQRARCAKLQDSELIENMRIKLETALANENKLRFQREQDKIARETAAEKLDGPCNKTSCPAFAIGGKLELEQERCSKLELELRREQRRAEELEAAVEKERQLGVQKIEIEKEIVHQLKRELLALEGQRESLNSQLVHVREQLSLRQVEAEALERKVRVLQETEIRRQRKRLSEQEELDKNRRALQKAQSLQYDLEQKIIDLEQEVHRLKQQLLDKKLQASEGDLRPEVEKLKVDLEESRVRDELRTQTRSPSPKVSSPVLEKLKSVNVMLEQHMTENAEVALTLSRLTEERQRLQTRVRELEEQLRNSVKDKGNDTSESMHMTFTKERAIWAQEKAALKVALAQAEADAFRGRRIGDGADTDDKVKHLFGKFLRAESYRKALVWQKRYLLVVLGGYQESEAITVSRLAQLSGIQESMVHHQNSPSQRRPKTRFRTVAIVVIALSRMRYMVQRWRLGRRIGSGAVLSRGFSETALSTAQSSYLGPRRRGSSTSIHSLGASRASSQPHRYGPLSPPSRDPSTLRRWQTDFVVQHHMRSSESIPISSLRPSHVSEYVDRFDELQRRLGLSVTSPPP